MYQSPCIIAVILRYQDITTNSSKIVGLDIQGSVGRGILSKIPCSEWVL